MPKYAKFMKNLLTNKRNLEDIEMMGLTGNLFSDSSEEVAKEINRSWKFHYFLHDGRWN